MTSNGGPGQIWADLSRGNQQLQFNWRQDEPCGIPGHDQPAVTRLAGTVLNSTESAGNRWLVYRPHAT